jgi:threonine dehydrogenase-like Zn-dependent dehydrogenase
MPEIYDRCLGPALFAPFAAHLATMAAELSPQRVLELAAGTGIATTELVRALPAADITATDLNPAQWCLGQQTGSVAPPGCRPMHNSWTSRTAPST